MNVLIVLGKLVDVIYLANVDNFIIVQLFIIGFFVKSHCVQEVKILGNFEFFGWNLTEFLVLKGDLNCVENVEPRVEMIIW